MSTGYDIKQFCIVPPPYGGASVYARRLISMLAKDGYAVGGYYSSDSHDEKLRKDPMFDEWTWMETSRYFYKILKYIGETRKYKIVHSHFGLEGMLYLWTLQTFFRKKIVVTIHNSMVSDYFGRTNAINRFFLKRMLRSDVTWIAVSEQGRSQMMQLPVTPKNGVVVVTPYIPDMEIRPPLSDKIQEYLNNHKKNIAFYGHSFMVFRGTDVYGFTTAIRSYAALVEDYPDLGFVLCVADDSDEEKISALHRLAEDCGVDKKIFWQIGGFDNIIALWKQVHIYFRPTSTDGDSVAVREAIDEGAIVVASDVAPRPSGVITFSYGDLNDAIQKLRLALNRERDQANKDLRYYIQMKTIYDGLLSK